MNLSLLGHLGVWLALVGFLGAALRQGLGLRLKTSPSILPLTLLGLAGLVLAVGVMQGALVTHDFSLGYVAENNATFTPLIYSITGMWSALEGSILLWALILGVVVTVVVARYRARRADTVVAWAQLILMIVASFFTALMAGPADPFVRTATATSQGAGPNALLQDNPLVAIHPPLLYAGFVGCTVPFAFAIAMLITGRVGEDWPFVLRRWTVLSWGFLSVGIVMGAWWSYQVLGWGGFWGWDPVENAALLPWLTMTAYVHSVIVQERRGLFRVWNMSLAIVTFALTVLGTFFTRSGVLQSVHAFSSSTLGPILIGFFAITIGGGAALVAWRGDRLRSPVGVDAPFSREGLFVANNILFVGFALVVLAGTLFPLLYEAVNGGQVSVGAPYFAKVAAPVAVALLALMALAPVAGWRSAPSGVLWDRLRATAWVALALVAGCWLAGVRKPLVLGAYFLATMAAGTAVRALVNVAVSARRKGTLATAWRGASVGGMVAHLGVVVLTVGIVTSTSYTTRHEIALKPHAPTVQGGHVYDFTGVTQVTSSLLTAEKVNVTIDGVPLAPAVTTYHGRDGQVVGTPAVHSTWWRDLYVTFDAVGGSSSTSGAQLASDLPAGDVLVGVTEEPLLAWLWIGGLVVGLGAALSFVRERSR